MEASIAHPLWTPGGIIVLLDRMKLRHFLGMVASLMFIYVLSSGPLAWRLPPDTVYPKVYAPLYLLSSKFPAVGRVLNWYVHLWMPNGTAAAEASGGSMVAGAG